MSRNTRNTSMIFGAAALIALVFTLTASFGGPRGTDTTIPHPALPPIEGVETAVLTDAPSVPPPIRRDHAARVVVELETIEVTKEIAPGLEYRFWTFGGSVPGKFIRVREGDLVEFHLKNDEGSLVSHNIDLHAVTGPHGGGSSSMTGRGEESVFTFRALNPGLYVYHCATPPVGMHIANGMYGLILVEPERGLPAVDREFYVMQGDYYVKDSAEEGVLEFDYQKAVEEDADYVLFNGRKGALTDGGALKARTGESIRLFFGNGGPNLVSSFHVIGEIFDNVYAEGGTAVNHNVQTTLVPAGGATMVEFRADVPGPLVLVDHSIFRAFDKGAMGVIDVEGPAVAEIFDGGSHADDR